ncbi:AraC family transcriptional regulator [Megalodesulfovibrio gigas]|uniref:Putative AraC family transcriptional regulator n=1 Tax=Megalodesulfovibrio gigas (strain ATCC 19364 / DSM 1382 / NCIMB 9332 / VKM B-1759) TaxID=1121448 RepID=T2G9V9_MEGG1|nr:GyrI-like domain-containing protein [Megalodesulfovibrio gigas]AGW12916.1 putative AraC family transcriptional regulator [Megalodesulfovibrio gigas DSM 1382 = ATCC 19364]
MDVTVVELPERLVASVRHVGPYQQAETAWMTLMAWAMPANAAGPDALYLGVSYDNPEVVPQDQLRYDACLTVPEGTTVTPPVVLQTLAGGRFATGVHQGPYDKLPEAYAALMAGAAAQGLTFRMAPCMEQCLNDPRTTPPEQLLTAVFMPVE